MWFHKLFQDLSHEGETINVDIGEMASQRSIQMWQYFNDEQPPPRRTCTRATVEYNSIYHNNGKEVGEVSPPRVIVLTSRVIERGFKPQLGETKVLVASPLWGKTCWLGIRIMYQSGVIYLSTDCCFRERTSSSTCSCHEAVGKSLTHPRTF